MTGPRRPYAISKVTASSRSSRQTGASLGSPVLGAMTNKCTGAPGYASEQDSDPRADTDCATGRPQALTVRVTELQALAQ